MRKCKNVETSTIAEELQTALRNKKVKYVQVKACPRPNNPDEFYYSVTEYKLKGSP